MADLLTLLEAKLDLHFLERQAMISDARCVPNWDDYNYRSGYLEAIRRIGDMIKEIRNPETKTETGEIPSVIEEISYD